MQTYECWAVTPARGQWAGRQMRYVSRRPRAMPGAGSVPAGRSSARDGRELHGAPLDYRQVNIYRLPEAGLTQYEIVLCPGVLYHLPDMVRALHHLRERRSGRLILETLVAMDLGREPLARYHPASSLNNDDTNF